MTFTLATGATKLLAAGNHLMPDWRGFWVRRGAAFSSQRWAARVRRPVRTAGPSPGAGRDSNRHATATVTTLVPLNDCVVKFPAWSHGGDRIAYCGYPSGGQEAVYLIPAASGAGATRVVDGAAPTWSPDDTKLLFSLTPS